VHPQKAVPSADRLTAMAYPSGHLIHMPSYIYIRVGRYNDAAIANEKAIVVDENYIAACKAQGVYAALYYPHNVHFLWFAANMEGRSKVALEAARKLDKKVPYFMTTDVPLLERFKSIPIFTLVRFNKWEEVLKEPRPDAHFIYSQAMWHFSRGMAYAHKGNRKKAKEELALAEKASKKETLIALDDPQFPTIGICEIAVNVLRAEIEGQNGNYDKKVDYLKKAVIAQDGLIYMEPPFFYYPVRQSLGAALLEAKRAAEAEVVFKEDLTSFPANGWSLKGLQKSLEIQGKKEEADKASVEFTTAWIHADVSLETSEL